MGYDRRLSAPEPDRDDIRARLHGGLADRAVLIEGLQSWRWGDRKDEIHEPRLAAKIRHALNLDEVRLVLPPAFDERLDARPGSIAARIFPTWFLVQEEKKTGPSGRSRRRLVQWKYDAKAS